MCWTTRIQDGSTSAVLPPLSWLLNTEETLKTGMHGPGGPAGAVDRFWRGPHGSVPILAAKAFLFLSNFFLPPAPCHGP